MVQEVNTRSIDTKAIAKRKSVRRVATNLGDNAW